MTPDPKFVFYSVKHREALAHLLYGIRERQGFIEITGEVGTGKTTLCRALVNTLDNKTKFAMVLNSDLSEVDLLKTILEEFDLETESSEKKVLLDNLNQFLIKQLSLGNNVVLVIDEAQNLKSETLEQIRLLSNLETEREKLLQIVLVGQPELKDKLALPELRQLNQRITVRYHIKPLSKKETHEYIYYRLSIAGDEQEIFVTPNACSAIFNLTGGIPRLINVLSHHTLLAAYAKREHKITRTMVKKAYKDFNDEKGFFTKKRKTALGGSMGFGPAYSLPAGVALGAILFFAVGYEGKKGKNFDVSHLMNKALVSAKGTVYSSINYMQNGGSSKIKHSDMSASLLSKYFSALKISSGKIHGKTVNPFKAASSIALKGSVNSVPVSMLKKSLRPFLLECTIEGRKTRMILRSYRDGKFYMMGEDGEKVFDEDNFDEIYSGNALLFRPAWLDLGDTKYHLAVKKVQRKLWELRYFSGVPGGFVGEKTKDALIKFQINNGLDPTGVLDVYTQTLFAGKLESADTSNNIYRPRS